MMFWLLACSIAPYSDYWPDRTAYPIVTSLSPDTIDGRAGGQMINIEGRQLSNTTTVIVGGRNAEIVSVDDRVVQIRLPDLPAGPDALALSVVTGNGASTMEGALSVDTPISDFVKGESVSVSLARYDCPAEAWGTYDDGEQYPYGWCGAEMGYVSADAWMGVGAQPGFAAETAAILPLSELPPFGQVRVLGPGERSPPTVPLVFGAHGAKESISIQQPRDFDRDLLVLQERTILFEETYSWTDSITDWRSPVVTLMDDEQCWLDSLDVESVDGDELTLSDDATGATQMTLGFAFEEDYGDFLYTDSAAVFGAAIDADGATVRSEVSGVALGYDAYSGWFLPEQFVGPGDIAPGEYVVSTLDAEGRVSEQGYVLGMTPLSIWSTTPQLMTGYEAVPVSEDLEVTWEPAPQTKSPTVIAVEIAVYDMDVLGPNGPPLVGRLVSSAADVDGRLVISSGDLERLPLAPNRWDEWDETAGYWGDMTITRHEFRKVRRDGGDMVIDFIHAINGPVVLHAEP